MIQIEYSFTFQRRFACFDGWKWCVQ